MTFRQIQSELCDERVRHRKLRYCKCRDSELANAHDTNTELSNADNAAAELPDRDDTACYNRPSVRPVLE